MTSYVFSFIISYCIKFYIWTFFIIIIQFEASNLSLILFHTSNIFWFSPSSDVNWTISRIGCFLLVYLEKGREFEIEIEWRVLNFNCIWIKLVGFWIYFKFWLNWQVFLKYVFKKCLGVPCCSVKSSPAVRGFTVHATHYEIYVSKYFFKK